jgi:predicted ATPase
LERLPDKAGVAHQELKLQSVLAAALVATVGNAAAETGQAYARARTLCEQLGDMTTLVPVLSGLSTYYQTRSDFAALGQNSLDLLRLGQELGDPASELVGNRSMALCMYHLGEFRAAREHFERVLRIYVPEETSSPHIDRRVRHASRRAHLPGAVRPDPRLSRAGPALEPASLDLEPKPAAPAHPCVFVELCRLSFIC